MQKHEFAVHSKHALPETGGLKKRCRKLLRGAYLSTFGSLASKPNAPFLRSLFCHYVFDDQVREFEIMMDELQKAGTFVDSDSFISMMEGKTPIDKGYFHLSFDDGFRNIFLNAAPILSKRNIPALIFAATSFVGTDWKTARHFCMEKGNYSGVIEMMNLEELREMKSRGFEVGSHTRTHGRLSDISGNKTLLDREVLGSKLELEDKLGSECKFIAWPFGRLNDIDEVSLDAIKNAGYYACFGGYRGLVLPGETDRFKIPRHNFEAQWPLSHIKYFAYGKNEPL